MMNNDYLRSLPIIGLDCGNKLVKCPNALFHAGLDHYTEKPGIWLGEGSDLLRYNGRYYGVSNKRLLYERDKTANEDYLCLSLIGIAKELEARGMSPGQEIVLAVGLPPGHMAGDALTRSLRGYYLRNGGEYRYRCGETQHHIVIREVVVCPQAYSALLTLPKDVIQKPSVHIADIGGGTMDDVTLVNRRPAPDMFSLDMGVIYLYNAIRRKLSGVYGLDLTEEQIDSALSDPSAPLFSRNPEYIDLIHEQAEAHVKNIFRSAHEGGANWRTSFVVFCGGGSILLKEYIERHAARNTDGFVILDDIQANAKGFELFARITLANRK